MQTLHLFSGPDDREDGIAAFLDADGIGMDCIDLVNEKTVDRDISDDAVWNRLKAVLAAGYYHFVFAGPPCRTFSLARHVRPGPPPLRDRQHPYGFPKSQAKARGITPGDFEKLRLDNLLAVRTAEACTIMADMGRGFAVEQPALWGDRSKDAATMFDLDPFAALQKRGAKIMVLDQCMYGAETTKPTQLLYFNGRFDRLEASCNHPTVLWQQPKGRDIWARHRPCVGTKTAAGHYATSALAAYPKDLNKRLAEVIAESLVDAC